MRTLIRSLIYKMIIMTAIIMTQKIAKKRVRLTIMKRIIVLNMINKKINSMTSYKTLNMKKKCLTKVLMRTL